MPDNRDAIAEWWLVVSTCLPRWRAVASTIALPDFVRTSELNRLFHGLRVYLVLHIGSILFGWNRQEGWRLVADPDADERERNRRRMNDPIFSEIPAHHR